MALWIYAAIALTALVPILIGMGIGTRAGKKRGELRQGLRKGALIGALVGVVLVAVTFFDHVLFSADVDLELPRNFEHDWVILVEDRRATRTLEWNPLTRHAHVKVPRSGIVRLRSLDALEGKPIRGSVVGGSSSLGHMYRTLSTDAGYSPLVGFVVTSTLEPTPDWDVLDDAAALELIEQGERAR